jgi:hypothetical protein
MNQEFAKLNLLNSKSLEDIRQWSTTDCKTDISWITHYWGNADIKNADKWQYEQFDYSINEFGFRGNSLPNETDLAAFGCSFTFGTGLAENMLWTNILAKELNKTSINFGLPARSIQSIIDMFLIVSKHIKIKNAIFLLPSLSRLQFAKMHPTDNDVNYLNTCVDNRSELNKIYGLDEDSIYRAIPEEEMYKICKNQLYLLDYISKERNINVYISSWEQQTYDFLKQLELESVQILPMWTSSTMEFASKDKARDNHHPGPLHHLKWVDEIKGYIK